MFKFILSGLMLVVSCACHTSNRIDPLPPAPPPTKNVIYYAGELDTGVQLWTTNGTPAGTQLLKIINKTGTTQRSFESYAAHDFTFYNGSYYFAADDGVHGFELWKTNGTTASTVMVSDIYPGEIGGLAYMSQNKILALDNIGLFFCATTPQTGRELWSIKGTETNVSCIQETAPGIAVGSPQYYQKFFDSIIFNATNSNGHRKVYRSNSDLSAFEEITALATCQYPAVVNDKIIYWGYPPGSSKLELYSNQGRLGSDEIILQSDMIPVEPHWDREKGFTAINGLVFMEMEDKDRKYSLWVTDGTKVGTRKLMNIKIPTKEISTSVIFYNNKWFFNADDGVHGFELWCTDGTQAGTQLFKDLVSGSGESSPSASVFYKLTSGGFFIFNNLLYFGANFVQDGFSNHVLWVTDGTVAGTRPLVDPLVSPTEVPCWPAAYCAVGNTLYFSANKPGGNRQVWRYDESTKSCFQITSHDYGDTRQLIWTIVPAPAN